MKDKIDINSIRNSGGKADIGTEEEGAIVDMFNLGNKLILIKENAVYELVLADSIDPKRENPNLPLNTHKLLLKIGAHSAMFCRTFLTAKNLLREEFLLKTINTNKGLHLAFEIVQELQILSNEIDEFLKLEQAAIIEYENRRSKDLDHSVPSITNVKSRCKTIFQKADQIQQAQFEIIKMFYPEFSKTSYYTKFLEFIKDEYGESDKFYLFLSNAVTFIELSRNIRNCLDHRRSEINIIDFELQINNEILNPTIEINYLNSKMGRTSLSSFLPLVRENSITVFENLIANLCSKKIEPKSIIHKQVAIIPENKRINKNVKFGYWLPIGDEGFYYN